MSCFKRAIPIPIKFLQATKRETAVMGSDGEEDQHSPLMTNFSDTDAEQSFKRTGNLSLSLSKHPTFGSRSTFYVLLQTLGIFGVRKR